MRPQGRFSSKRLIFLSSVLVFMGLLALGWLQYRFLESTRSATALALKGNLHQNAETFSRRFEAALAEIDSTVSAGLPDSPDVLKQLKYLKTRYDLLHRRYPEIPSLFLVPDYSRDRNQRVLVADSSGARIQQLRRPADVPEWANVLDVIDRFSNRGSGRGHLAFSLVAAGCACARAAGHIPSMYLIHAKRLLGRPFSTAFLVVSLPPELFEQRLLPEVSAAIANPGELNVQTIGATASRMFFTVYSSEGAPVYFSSSSQRTGNQEGREFLGDVLPGWTVSAAYSGPDVEQMVSRQLRRSVLVFGFSFLVLLAGIVLIARSISVELRNARRRDDFVANVSHEMMTPLAAIHMFSQTLELKRISAPAIAEEYPGIIRKHAERLTILIERLLDLARTPSNQRSYHFTTARIEEVLGFVLDEYRDVFREREFSVEISFEDALPAVKIDREAMAQVFRNLLDNAIKYSGEGRELMVGVSKAPSKVLVVIRDSGIGISRSEHRNIFQKFYRVHTGMVHDVKGTGLGLSICERIVREHNGRISVESCPGKGSIFTVHLPAYHQS
jgi:signal transduction histidine kinase